MTQGPSPWTKWLEVVDAIGPLTTASLADGLIGALDLSRSTEGT